MNNNAVVKSDKRDFHNTTLHLRLRDAEAVRFYHILDLALARNRFAEKSDVIRELIGLSKPNLLTKEEIEFFKTGKKNA